MRRTGLLAPALVLAVGCGDNVDAVLEDAPCAPVTQPAPIDGPFADPRALPWPATCVEGGLVDLPGRWFVRDPSKSFLFFYPKFESSCSAGLRRANWADEDLDSTDDNYAFQTWSDGTRFYYRDYRKFEFQGQVYELAQAIGLCMLPDGTLAGVQAAFETDRGEFFSDLIGTRFGIKDAPAHNLELVGELRFIPGTAEFPIMGYNVAVDGDLAVVAGPLGLDVIDVSDPTTPVHLRHVVGGFNDVKLARGATSLVAYAAPMSSDRTAIVDLTTPSTASIVGQIAEYSHSLFVAPSTPPKLYLANYTGGIPVFDVTNPLIPVRIAGVSVAGDAGAGIHDLHVTSDRIYVNKTTDGVVGLDVSAGLDAAVELGRLASSYSHASWPGVAGGREILLHGDEGMTPEGGALLRILDADRASPTFMQEIGRYKTRAEVGIHNIVLVEDKAYIAYYHDGVRVVDLSDPTQPREVGHYNTWDVDNAAGDGFEGAVGLTVVGDLIYVADSNRGLLILRDRTP